jgi:Ca2+-binding RTX toxin-like protein
VSLNFLLTMVFYLIGIVIASSSFFLPVVGLGGTAANARSSSDNILVSSKSTSVGTFQLPLPTNAISETMSQITAGQDGAIGYSSGSGGISTTRNYLENRIQGLSLSPGSTTSGNVITCRPVIPCVGTNNTDIIMAGISEQVFGLKGSDMIYGAADDQLYGSKGNDIILSGAGNSLADGGPGDDVLTGGIGHSLLIGGPGNDKLFAGPGDTVMEGGSGANHFDCPLSVAGLARSIVLDYNPSNGDTISGQCTLVNNVGRSGVGGGEGAGAAATLPDSGETPSSSPSSGNNLAIEGVIAGRGSSR